MVASAALIILPAAAMQLEFDKFCTAVWEVDVSDPWAVVSVPSIADGVDRSMFTESTTNTSESKGDKLRSLLPCVNVLAPDSTTSKPIATILEVCFNPVGISWGYPKVLYILHPSLLLISIPVVG